MPSLTSCCRALDLPTMPSLSMHRKHQAVRRRDDGVLDMMMATCRRGNGGGRDVQAGDPGRTKSQSVEGRSPKITTTSTRAQCVRLWQAWIPAEVGQRMASVAAPWYVAAGRPCVWTPAHVGTRLSSLPSTVSAGHDPNPTQSCAHQLRKPGAAVAKHQYTGPGRR